MVTGARGFIGRHLVTALHGRGTLVAGIGHGEWPDHAASGVTTWLDAEVDERSLCAAAERLGSPATIFHLAGGSSVRNSLEAPQRDFERTVGSTARVLEWTRTHSPETTVVLASSAAVYGSAADAIAETAAIAPVSPYGGHKAMGEWLCRWRGSQYGVRTAAVRLFSVYGPGLRKQLVWDLSSRIRAGESPVILGGTGEERRDWLYVKDAVRLILIAAGHASPAGLLVNGGTGVATTVREIAAAVAAAWGAAMPVFSGARRAGDPDALVADPTYARSLGFQPRVPLREGLRETVAWIRAAGVTS